MTEPRSLDEVEERWRQLGLLVQQQAEALDRTVDTLHTFARTTVETLGHIVQAIEGLEHVAKVLMKRMEENEEGTR